MNKDINKKSFSPCFTFRRKLNSCQDLVRKLLDEIYLWMSQADINNDDITNIQIVLAEVLNNIIEHGYGAKNSGTIHVAIDISINNISVHVTDNGIAYTPPHKTRTPFKDNSDISALPEGGFGWFLINKITSSYKYHRRGTLNVLILGFNRKAKIL